LTYEIGLLIVIKDLTGGKLELLSTGDPYLIAHSSLSNSSLTELVCCFVAIVAVDYLMDFKVGCFSLQVKLWLLEFFTFNDYYRILIGANL
jgi:hypothetical protein